MTSRSELWKAENARLALEHECEIIDGKWYWDGTPVPTHVTDALVDKSLALREARKTIYKRCTQIKVVMKRRGRFANPVTVSAPRARALKMRADVAVIQKELRHNELLPRRVSL